MAVEFILEILPKSEYAVLDSVDQIEAVGHRLVHGGEAINKSVLINDEVIEQVKRVSDLAPLHNPPSLKGIDAITKLLPKVQQVAVFDTAFHQTMPAYTYMYALPYEYYEKYGVRRYGFHGTSHRYISHRACEILGKDFDKTRIITCHFDRSCMQWQGPRHLYGLDPYGWSDDGYSLRKHRSRYRALYHGA